MKICQPVSDTVRGSLHGAHGLVDPTGVAAGVKARRQIEPCLQQTPIDKRQAGKSANYAQSTGWSITCNLSVSVLRNASACPTTLTTPYSVIVELYVFEFVVDLLCCCTANPRQINYTNACRLTTNQHVRFFLSNANEV